MQQKPLLYYLLFLSAYFCSLITMELIVGNKNCLLHSQGKMTEALDNYSVFKNCYMGKNKDESYLHYLENEVKTYDKDISRYKQLIKQEESQAELPSSDYLNVIIKAVKEAMNSPYIYDDGDILSYVKTQLLKYKDENKVQTSDGTN